MARFYRRIQIRHVVRLFQVSLADLMIALTVSVLAGVAANSAKNAFEYKGFGGSWIVPGAAFIVFYLLLKLYRREGDGVRRKDGRFRHDESARINRVLIPDPPGAPELFLVVVDEGHSGPSGLAACLQSLKYGLGLEKKPLRTNQIPGSVFCSKLALRNKS